MDKLLLIFIKITDAIRVREKGSISLEYILFVVAVVAVSGGILAFYTNIGDWFENITLPAQPEF